VALLHPRETPARVVVAGLTASVLPDLDVIAFRLHIPYASTFGHRGFTHSIVFALLSATLLTLAVRDRRAFPFLFVCALSHPLLDALTNGGRGVALLWPFSDQRFFAPWRPIRVSPIGRVDWRVLRSEAKWVWLPAIAGWAVWRGVSAARRRG
jgi:inner membrane protein